MSEIRPGVLSVILVNFRGASDTIEAIRGLDSLDWDAERLELVVVENASGDDSAALIAAAAPHVRLIVSPSNLGFAGGCNLGVRSSTGEYVAFLNNDARPHPAWARTAITEFESAADVGAVACRVLDWDGKRVDFIGSGLTWFGMGYKPFAGELYRQSMPQAGSVLFGTGSAMFVRRTVFDELDGFDESFFMFFEDVDFGWRLNLRGWRYAYVDDSVAYHKHHASMTSFGNFKETYLLERNALYALYKNLGADALARALPAAMALAIRRSVAKGSLDSTQFDLRKPGGDDERELGVAKETLAGVFAVDQFVANLDSLRESRQAIQESRVISDNRLWKLFGQTDAPSYEDSYYLDGYMSLATSFDVLEPPVRTRVLVVTGDPIGAKLAGPAIRAWNISAALSVDSDVTLMSLASVEPMTAPFELVSIEHENQRQFAQYEAWADVIVFQGHAMEIFSALEKSTKIVVADIYDPMHLEQLEQARELPQRVWEERVGHATAVLNQQLERADFLICASDRQRLFYLGQLAALGRVNPQTYATDPHLTDLISVIPFGLEREFPAQDRKVLKGVLPGIGPDDKVILWSGGLYSWFDPKSLITAVARLNETRPEVKLFFQGTKHPHPGVPEMAIVSESRELAEELGVLNSSVFFNASWVEYSDRHNYLSEADAGVSTHFSHLETTMSFRTRILDYLWAELPMVVSDGDYFAELVSKEELGIVVPAEDVDALAAALERILFDQEFVTRVRANIARVRDSFAWDVVLEPLIRFMKNPRRARDTELTAAHRPHGQARRGPVRLPSRKRGFLHNVSRTFYYLRHGGVAVVAEKIKRRLGR